MTDRRRAPGVGVVLAGGEGRRIGGGKHYRRLAGVSLLDRALRRLRPQVGALAVSVGREPIEGLDADVEQLVDPVEPAAGPLAGLLAGLEWLTRRHPRAPFLAVVPVDAPFLPETLVAQLAPALKGRDAAVAAGARGATPVVGLFRPKLAERLGAWLANDGERSVAAFLAGSKVAEVEIVADPRLAAVHADPLFNVNTEADLARAESILARLTVAARPARPVRVGRRAVPSYAHPHHDQPRVRPMDAQPTPRHHETAEPPEAARPAAISSEAAPAPAREFHRIALMASSTPEAQAAAEQLAAGYETVAAEEADIVIALGGDGLMLRALHRFMNTGIPIYGMNRGSVGFLMNEFGVDELEQRLARASITAIRPLAMEAVDADGKVHHARAINEVSLLRETQQAAKLSIAIDGRTRLSELVCDGVLVATPAGSTAYNLSAHGPILPINAKLLALTPISAFRPRRWRGALLPDHVTVEIVCRDAEIRPVAAAADHVEIRDVVRVRIAEDKTSESLIMFDPDHSWDERILNEQFQY